MIASNFSGNTCSWFEKSVDEKDPGLPCLTITVNVDIAGGAT